MIDENEVISEITKFRNRLFCMMGKHKYCRREEMHMVLCKVIQIVEEIAENKQPWKQAVMQHFTTIE